MAMSCHLGIRPSGSPFPKKAPLYEDVGSIPGIFKNIRVCEFRLEFLSYLKKKKKMAMSMKIYPKGSE
jgi:hypothetical protein